MSAIIRAIFGIIFGVICVVVLMPGLAYFQTSLSHKTGILALAESPSLSTYQSVSSDPSMILALVIVAAVAALSLLASNIRRAMGRGFLFLAISFFAIPLSLMVLTGRLSDEMMGAAAAGEQAVLNSIAAIVVTGLFTPFAIFFGAIFTVIGLILALGGRRKVVVVSK
jgi:hypothetical protein